MVSSHGEAVAIAGRLGPASCLLRSHVIGSAGPGMRSSPVRRTREQFGNAEVRQKQPPLLQKHIGGLNVAVQHLLAMRKVDSLCRLAQIAQRLVNWQRSAGTQDTVAQ